MAVFQWSGTSDATSSADAWIDVTDPTKTGKAVPGATDTVQFEDPGDVNGGGGFSEVDIDAEVTFDLKSSELSAETLMLSASFTVNGALLFSTLMGDGSSTITIGSDGALDASAVDLVVGPNGLGGIVGDDGATVAVQSLSIDDAKSVSLQGTGATLITTNGGDVQVGQTSEGTLELDNGATLVTTGSAEIGVDAGADGTVTIDAMSNGGSGLDSSATGSLTVGAGGSGSLTLKNGASILVATSNYSATMIIGDQAGSEGDVVLDPSNEVGSGTALQSPGEINVHGTLEVGNAGTGTLLITDQGKVIPVAGLNVSQNGSIAVTYGNVGVGLQSGGSGTVTIEDGGELDASILAIGSAQGATGEVDLGADGSGTVTVQTTPVLNVTSGILIGDSGTGTLKIEGGGHVSVAGSADVNAGGTLAIDGQIIVGNQATGSGTLIVDGSNVTPISDLTITSNLDQELKDGTALSTVLAQNGGSIIPVGITGLQDFGDLAVGAAGQGTFDLKSNAIAFITGTLSVGVTGSGQVTQGPGTSLFALAGIDLGAGQGGSGTVAIQGGDDASQLTSLSTLQLIVGDAGTGSLTTSGSDGSIFIFSLFTGIGQSAGSTGSLTLGSSNAQSATIGLTGVALPTTNNIALAVGGSASAAGGTGTLTLYDTSSITLVGGAVVWGSGTVALEGNDASFGIYGQLTIKAGASFGGHGEIDNAANTSTGDSGSSSVLSGSITTDADITASGGTLAFGNVAISGSGALVIDQGATLSLMENNTNSAAGTVVSTDIVFSNGDPGETLEIVDPGSIEGEIKGFSAGDTILINLAGTSRAGEVIASTPLYDPTTEFLSFYHGDALLGGLTVAGDYGADDFRVNAVSGETDEYAVTLACFVSGTRIATDAGDVAVEALAAGDHVVLYAGGQATVRWVGHRRCRPGPQGQPVRIRPHAFGPGQPQRDLYISPDHAVYVEGVLVPIRALVDGAAIAQDPTEDGEVVYHHILLDQHDVILAEGLACESLLDDLHDAPFDNADECPPSLAFLRPCAPRVTQGPMVERARAVLRANSAMV